MIKRVFAALAVVTLFPTASSAEVVLCKMQDYDRGNFIPKELIVKVDQKAGKVVVFDPFIQLLREKPLHLQAEITDDRAKFSWKFTDFPLKYNKTGTVSYKATYLRDRKRLFMKGLGPGFDNDIRGEGNCAPYKSR